MFKDLGTILYWWFFYLGIGLIFFPITKRIFSRFFDQGYLFSKVIGIGISSYLVWLLASLKILPFNRETILLVLIVGIIVNLIVSRRSPSPTSHPRPTSHFSPSLSIIICEELMFLITLTVWSFIRGFQPDIQGLEKFMDFGFVNTILRSKYFPPADMWFAGKYINYYYFGHYITAFFTKLSGIDSAITYNLMLGTLFAFTFSLAFSLTANLVYFWKKSISKLTPITQHLSPMINAGLIAAFLISIGANLHPSIYNFQMKVLKKPYCDGSLNYWYPNATRYIGVCPDVEDKTIHEFPSYSFIVSDLHGHVSDIPFVFLFLALSLNLLIILKEKKEINFKYYILHFTLPVSLTLAIMFMTNQWDFPIYIMVLGLTLFFHYYSIFNNVKKTVIKCFFIGCLLTLPSLLLILPFQLNFEPFFSGIDFVRAHSRFYQLLVLYGAPWFFGLTFFIFLFHNRLRFKNSFKKENLIKWFSKILDVKIQFQKSVKISSSSYSSSPLYPSDLFIIIIFLVSLFLIIFPEIFYIKDIYIPSHHRANTMFKLTYQAFMMYCVMIGYVYVRILSSMKNGLPRKLLKTIYIIMIGALLIYPFYSISGYYGKLQKENYKGLYGLNFLKRLYPSDYEAVIWLNNNVSGQPVVLEAVGDSYTDYERISMATGLPTIEGWLVHEWLWRGSFDEPGKRSGDVQTIYESTDLTQTKQLLEQYKVKYIIVGEMEKTKYPNLDENKIKSLGKEVFKSEKTTIYELN